MTTSINPELTLTLDDAVSEVSGILTGLEMTFVPEYDKYRGITRALNRALRSNALEREWSYYNDTFSLGSATEGVNTMDFPNTWRPRVTSDDAIRLVDDEGANRVWAYFLPLDALHKYGHRHEGLWAAVRRNTVMFSRPFNSGESGWDVQIPVMREPVMFRLPDPPEDPDDPVETVAPEIRDQPIDFSYPDLVITKAAYYYAQTDPVMQPRVQTLEMQYKDLMYQVIERDDRSTDSPYLNEFFVPVDNGIDGQTGWHDMHGHPHSDGRR